jgi:hypothetical protein
MKTLVNLISYALIVLMGVFMSLSLASCSESYSDEDRIAPVPPTPTPRDTTKTPTTDNTWRWNTIVDQTVSFDTATEIVEANNIAQLSKSNGETKLDSATLRYNFGVELTAPTRIVTTSKDTTVYTGKGLQKSEYSDFVRTGNDSLRTVTTTVEGGFKTSYYTLSLTTSRKEGFSLHAGKWLSYKNVTESSQLTSIWHEAIREVEINDSVFNREVVHNILTITLKGSGQTWTLRREKVVVVDHFIKKIEEEPTPAEPEKVKADYWANNLKGFISCTKVWRDDTQSWSDAYLFECENTYEIILANYRVNDKKESFVSVEHKSVSKATCPASSDYNGVIQVGGNFYPAAITVNSDGWDVIGYINGKVESQTHADQFANNSGIKNQNKNNNAKPSPFITTTKVENKVNGKLVIKVTAKTLTHTGVYTMADSSLK